MSIDDAKDPGSETRADLEARFEALFQRMSPSMKETLERIAEQFGQVDETAMVVLKGHLLIEERLDAIISKFVHHGAFIENANLRFPQKVAIARSMSLDEHDNGMWDIPITLNSLRNDLAHALHSPKRAAKTQAVIDAYYREMDDPAHRKMIKEGMPEDLVLLFAISFFLGFLSSLQEEVNRFRTYVDALDLVVNANRNKPTGEPEVDTDGN